MSIAELMRWLGWPDGTRTDLLQERRVRAHQLCAPVMGLAGVDDADDDAHLVADDADGLDQIRVVADHDVTVCVVPEGVDQ